MGVSTDITERKHMEEVLQKSERMATIGELAAMVGHDLRNPLQGIAGAAYNIRRHLRDALDSSTQRDAGSHRQWSSVTQMESLTTC